MSEDVISFIIWARPRTAQKNCSSVCSFTLSLNALYKFYSMCTIIHANNFSVLYHQAFMNNVPSKCYSIALLRPYVSEKDQKNKKYDKGFHGKKIIMSTWNIQNKYKIF